MTHLGDVITTTTTTRGQPVDLNTPGPSAASLSISLLRAMLGFGITAQAKWAHKKDKEIIFTLNTRASCPDNR